MNLVLKCGQRYTEWQQPPNFLFVSHFMVKILRNGRQCLTLQPPPITSRCSTSLPTPQCSCSVACFRSTLKPQGYTVSTYPLPSSAKGIFLKIHFSLDTTTMLQREMEDHQLSVSSRGAGGAKRKKKSKERKPKRQKTHFIIKHGT